MAELQTLARPYARAIFDVAVKQDALDAWSAALQKMAEFASQSEVKALLGHPSVSADDVVALFAQVAGDPLPAGLENSLRLMAENRRLAVMPDVAEQFELLYETHRNRVEVGICSATEIDGAAQERLLNGLKKRLGREIDVQWSVDPELLGGAIVTADDLVIDGSVRGELSRLRTSLIQ